MSVLIVSDSNLCRSVLAGASRCLSQRRCPDTSFLSVLPLRSPHAAEALLQDMLRASPMASMVTVSSRALSDHARGARPSDHAVEVALELGVHLDAQKVSTPLHPDDLAAADLVLCLDRFDQEALLREGPHTEGHDCRVRRLTSFCEAPRLRGDVMDPFYGVSAAAAANSATSERARQQEEQVVRQRTWAAVRSIRAGCRGVVSHLQQLALNLGILCSAPAAAPGTGNWARPPVQGFRRNRAALRSDEKDVFPCTVQPEHGRPSLANALDVSLECPVDWGHSALMPSDATPSVRTATPALSPPHRQFWMHGGQMFTLRYVRRSRAAKGSLSRASASHRDSGHSSSPSPDDDMGDNAPPRVAVAVRYTPAERFKPHGYWSDISNVCNELREWMHARDQAREAKQQQPVRAGVMPSLAQLRASGEHMLEAAIMRHGGPRAVAKACGLMPRRGEYVTLTQEALASGVARVAAAARTTPGLMPPRTHFVQAGELGLYRALLARPGGIAGVARKLGLEWRKGPSGARYRFAKLMTYADARNAIDELAAAGACPPGVLPCRKELEAAGQLALYNRLVRLSAGSGMPGVAALLGLQFEGRVYRPRMAAGWSDGVGASRRGAPSSTLSLDDLRAELKTITDEYGTSISAKMPSIRQLQLAGRHDLCQAIVAHGGAAAVAAALGLARELRGRKARPGKVLPTAAIVGGPPSGRIRTVTGARNSVEQWLDVE